MKIKFMLALLSLVCLGYAADAQTVSIGPRVGATFTRVNYSGDRATIVNDEIESNTGVQLGLVANVVMNDVFSIQPELLYGQKGFTLEEDGLTYILRSEYLDIPVLGKFAFGSERLKGFVTAGPTLGYWAGGEEVLRSKEMEARQSFDFDDEQRGFRRFETGASFGVGLGYQVGAGYLNLDLRYGIGFTKLFDQPKGINSEIKNRGFGVSVAYLFSI